MEDGFNIYIERLRDGVVETISESFSPDFLREDRGEFRFLDPILLTGEAYIASDQLILHLAISTIVYLPCRVCNEWTPVDIKIKEMYDGIPIETIKSGIFSIRSLVRDSLMLQLPEYTECHNGQCPDRELIKKYIKEESDSLVDEPNGDQDGYQPFKEFKLD